MSGLPLLSGGGGGRKKESEEEEGGEKAPPLPPPAPAPTPNPTPTAATPAASCAPRPRVEHLSTRVAPALWAASTVASLDPPSTTTTIGFRWPIFRCRFRLLSSPFSPPFPSSRALFIAPAMLDSSLSAGMMTARVPTLEASAEASSLSSSFFLRRQNIEKSLCD